MRDKSKTWSIVSRVQPLKFGNGRANSSQTLLGIWLFIHAAIKVKLIHVNKRGPWLPGIELQQRLTSILFELCIEKIN